MMKRRKYCFNLIEITLAIAILAVGMSSIMVLFPVGLNANTAATADNNVADVAEQVIGHLKTAVQARLLKKQQDNPGQSIDLADVLKSDLKIADSYTSVKDDPDDSQWTQISGASSSEAAMPGTRMYVTANPRFYKIEQVSAYTDGASEKELVDFSAVVRVWTQDVDNFYLGTTPFTNQTTLKQNIASVNIEVSWPEDMPKEQRYKNGNYRIYRVELFNLVN